MHVLLLFLPMPILPPVRQFIPQQVSMVKRNSCGKALDIARVARDMLGGWCAIVTYPLNSNNLIPH